MADELTDYEYLRDNPSSFVENVIGVEPFVYQQEFMDADSRRKVFVAGRQVGKSRVASWMALHYAVTHPDSLVLVTADALRQSSELFSQLQSEINNSGLSDEQWGIERSTQTEIEFEHGSRIKVVPTGRNGNKIRGFTADMIIVDEAAFVENDIFEEVIEPMTFVSEGTIVLCSTPYGASGYFYDKAQDADAPDTEWTKTQVSSYDNPKIDEDDIESFKKGKTRNQIKQEVLGEFVPAGDQFFPNPLIRRCMNDDTEKGVIQYPGDNQEKRVDPDPKIYLGVDLGSSGDDETVFVKIDEYGNIFEIQTHDIETIQARKRIQQLDRHYNFEKIYVDEMGIGDGPVAELRQRLGRKVEGVKLSIQKKQSIYQTFKAHLESGHIRIINHEDARLQMEKLGYTTTRSGNLSIHAKEGFHDDICVSDDTEILTADGWASIGDIAFDSSVATYNDGTIEYQSPNRIIQKDYNGTMLHFDGHMTDMLVTPNHKMVYKRDTGSSWVYDESPAKEFTELNESTIHSNRLFPAAGKQHGSPINMGDWEFELLGWMITEGWINEDSRFDTRRYSVAQKNDSNIGEIVDRFDPHIYNRDDGCTYWTFHVSDNDYFDSLLSDGIHRIPRNVLTNASQRQLKILYDSMLSGDGHTDKNVYYTSNEELAKDFQELCHKIGYKSSITERTRDVTDPQGTVHENYTTYSVYAHINSEHNEMSRVSSVRSVPYDGYVWCVDVPNGTIVTRRNGTINITGNCDSMALAAWALPNTGGSGTMGAQGMTKPMTVGRITGSGSNKKYTFGQHEDEDDEELGRTFVGSTKMDLDRK